MLLQLSQLLQPSGHPVVSVKEYFLKSGKCPMYVIKKIYRLISLLPILGIIFEKVLFDSLYDYVFSNKLLTPCQSGFIKGDYCIN